MKKLIFTLMITLMSIAGFAQSGKWKINATGGISMPLDTYKNYIGRANNGPMAALSIDRYFNEAKVRWGLGFDFRYFRHNMRKFDTLFFNNGYISTDYHNKPQFTHLGGAFGPTAMVSAGPLELEIFARAGVLYQQFPDFTRSVWAKNTTGLVKVLDNHYTNNVKDHAMSWMGLGGIRASYPLSERISIVLQADYLRTFGKNFGSDASEYYVMHHDNPVDLDASMNIAFDGVGNPTNLANYFTSEPVPYKTHVQALNFSAGLSITFGKRREPSRKPISQDPVIEKAPEVVMKNILVVVKDKLTGLPLSGVKVDVKHGDMVYTSITDVSGKAKLIEAAEAADYVISGIKNGIKAEPGAISSSDFSQSGPVIYKEIYHNDPRFTLVGTTVDAQSGEKLAGIATLLTNTATKLNSRQQSDPEGKFVYQLDQQSGYNVVASNAGKFSQTEKVSTKGLDRSQTLYVKLKLGVSDIKEGVTFVLKNIHYDFDKADIRLDAAQILDNVVSIMKQNPTLRIELSSHTDSRGSDNYNLALSQRRANSAVDYLVSRGVDRSRLTAKGYGETRLLNRCANGVECSDAEHQANRRTEIKVLEY